MGKTKFFDVSEERKQSIIEEISGGSEPGFRFYALLATASLIAAFGLISNSTAVIIGAMLVSPLMTPIIGIALGVVIGRPHLAGTSMRSVVLGVILAIIFAALIGYLPLELAATPEMLSRTKPTILDLMVAVLAGFAGAYAMIDEKLSPALPGVAIATAIVPPLSNTGICIALGYYYGAFGSFMLFFANFLSILLVAGATFMLAGLSPWWVSISTKDLIRRFGFAIVGFIAVCVFLTYSLIGIVKERYLYNSIKNTLDTEILKLHSSSLDSFIYDIEDGKLYVLANVKSPRTITPYGVEMVQKKISNLTRMPTELIVRNVLSKDVGSFGSAGNVATQNLDGFFLKETLTADEKAVNIVEQELMDKLAFWPGMTLVDVEYVALPRGPTVVATIQGYRNLTENEINALEKELKTQMGDPRMSLIIRNIETSYSDRNGELIPGYKYGDSLTEDEKVMRNKIDLAIIDRFDGYESLFPVQTHHRPEDGTWDVLVEAVGTKVLTPGEVSELEKSVSAGIDREVNIDIWYRSDAVITDTGYMPFQKLNEQNVEELDKYLREHDEHQLNPLKPE